MAATTDGFQVAEIDLIQRHEGDVLGTSQSGTNRKIAFLNLARDIGLINRANRDAKNIVAAGLATQCQIQISYAIGIAEPTSISIDTFGTGKLNETELIKLVREHFDLRPKGIVQMLDLLRPIYGKTAAYGHFGREEPEFTWERTDKALTLKAAAGL